VLKDRLFFCADTMVNIEPTAEELAEIACLAADTARFFDIEPRVAMLSFSSFGSVPHPLASAWPEATSLARERGPTSSSTARCTSTRPSSRRSPDNYPHSRIRGDANVLIFPTWRRATSATSWCSASGRAEAIGPDPDGHAAARSTCCSTARR
jgi:malate dehydrogenase (oxaloacetate-decarboxylating)(NADP+)